MKLMDSHTKQIGDNIFYIRPFPAFKAANLSGEIASVVLPVLTWLAPLLGSDDGKGLLDTDLEAAAPQISDAFTSISGDKLETLLKHLLLSGKNISVELEGSTKAVPLTEDLVNEIFCEEVQDMFLLAFEVIRTNFNGFFKKLAAQFGSAMEALTKQAAS